MPADWNLTEEKNRRWNEFLELLKAKGLHAPSAPDFEKAAKTALIHSRFIRRIVWKDPKVVVDLWESGQLKSQILASEISKGLDKALSGISDRESLKKALRRFRNLQMLRIAWQDLTGTIGLEQTFMALSDLAAQCIRKALDLLFSWLIQDFGLPTLQDARPKTGSTGLVILGMGKLGARELNFSSDIDLMFVHTGPGRTQGQRRSLSHDEFYTLVAARLIDVLGSITADGFVFRVDTRLRPFGEGGPLVVSTEAMEQYYENFGRDWERYALIKAAPVAGDLALGEQLLDDLRPFIYRRYLDYSVFDSLRSMKNLIQQEMAKKGLKDHIKLGPGGIREVEFFCQVFQLIHGGRHPSLQVQGTIKALSALSTSGVLSDEICQDLIDAYCFLRTVENRLQEYDDQQTHVLPREERARQRLATSMGYESWTAFEKVLAGKRAIVHQHFEQLLAPQEQTTRTASSQHDLLVAIWADPTPSAQAEQALKSLGFTDPDRVLSRLSTLKSSSTAKAIHATERLERLVPLILEVTSKKSGPEKALSRVLRVIESIGRRPVYLSLLVENPKTIVHLIDLCNESAWITELLSRHPILLDELLEPETLYAPYGLEELSKELEEILARIPPDDLELFMDEMRRFRQAHVLRVAASDLAGRLTVEQVGKRLSWTAEVILARTLDYVWNHLQKRHGLTKEALQRRFYGLSIIGYGKLGGMEMGYSSDLDLVFLHSARPGQMTRGPSPIDSTLFYTRIGQRMIHILTTPTPAGVLYPVDMRLRPNGESGLLVSSLQGFFDYQMCQAWTWEHQALVKARAICGDKLLCKRFGQMRKKLLCIRRDEAVLKDAVCDMRTRILNQHTSNKNDTFDIKRHEGGLVDIEFITQFIVLSKAYRLPQLTRHTGTLDILRVSEELGALTKEDARILIRAYRMYLKRINQLALDLQPAKVQLSELKDLCLQVRHVWNKILA